MLVPPKTGGGRSHLFGASPHHPFLLLEPRGHHHISTPPMGEAGEPGNISSSERTFPHGWIQSRERSGEGGELPSSQPRWLNHWLVAPQETPGHAHLDRHVPSEARQIHPLAHATCSWPQLVRRGGCQPALGAGWGLLWPFLKVKGLVHPGLIQPGLAPV